MKREFVLLAVLAGSVAPSTPILAEDFSTEFRGDDPSAGSGPKWSVGVGTDYRLDDPEYHDYVPSECVQLYYRLASTLHLRLGFLHNSLTRLSSETCYHTVAADLGLRFHFDHSWATPYIESGFWMPYYWGVDDGHKYDDYHPGLRVAAGLSFRLSSSVRLNMGCSQVLNYIRQDYIVATPIPPIGGGYYFRDAPTGAYNEARFEAGICFGH
jgi:hypothetical protein